MPYVTSIFAYAACTYFLFAKKVGKDSFGGNPFDGTFASAARGGYSEQ